MYNMILCLISQTEENANMSQMCAAASVAVFPASTQPKLWKLILLSVKYIKWRIWTHYIAKSIESLPSNERFDYFTHFHEYKS